MTSEQFFGNYIPMVGAAGFLAGLILTGFKWVNQTVALDLRESVALWILGEPNRSSWSFTVAKIFEALYGTTYLSGRALVVNSSVCIAITGVVIFSSRSQFVDHDDFLILALLDVFYVIPVLFFSYLKSRWFVRRLATTNNTLRAVVILAIDLLCTGLLWTAWIGIIYFSAQFDSDGNVGIWVMPLVVISFGAYQFVPLFAAVLFPSFLIALVVATLVAQRLHVYAASFLGRVSRFLSKERIEKEPISLIGEVLAALAFIFVCAFGLLTAAP